MSKVIYIFGAFLIKTLAALIVLRLLASSYGDEGFGYLTQYMAFLAVLFGLSLGGGSNYLIKTLSQAQNHEWLDANVSEVFTYGFIFFLVLVVLLVLLKTPLEQYVFYRKVSWWFIAYLMGVFYVSNIYACLMGVALAQGRIALYSIAVVAGALVYLVGAIAIIYLGAADLAYWAIPLSYVLPVLFMRKVYTGKVRIDFWKLAEWSRFNDVFRYCVTIYAGLVSLPLVSIFVREAFNRNYGNQALSYWQVAVKFSDTLHQFFGTFCATLLLPYLSASIGKLKFDGWLTRLGMIALIYMSGAFFIYFFRGEVIFLLFGHGYVEGEKYFSYYLVGDLFRVSAIFCVFTLISMGNFGRVLIFELMQGGVFILFFYMFSGLGEIKGVGFAYVATYALCFCIMLACVVDCFRRSAR